MPDKVNTLILGQGLAGTLLSYELLKRGQSVLVVDDADPNSASRIAAGLVSPVTGQRTALIWRAAELLKAAAQSYAALEALLGTRFYFPTPLQRLYTDDEQRRRFRARKLESSHAPWLGEEFGSGAGIEIKGTARLDAAGLCTAWRKQLSAQGALLESKINLSEIEFRQDGAAWNGIRAGQVVACLGAREAGQGLFKFLKFQPTKGELLTVEAGADGGAIRYGQHFAIPLGSGRFRVGATYDREDLSPQPTPAGLAALEKSASDLLGPSAKTTSHEAGIRPNLLGHFPALGAHPKIPALAILNGFGSKGALWAPYCAGVMAEWILSGKEIPGELNVSRFKPTGENPASA